LCAGRHSLRTSQNLATISYFSGNHFFLLTDTLFIVHFKHHSILVFVEALERWRKNKNTIVITHTTAEPVFQLEHGAGVDEFPEMCISRPEVPPNPPIDDKKVHALLDTDDEDDEEAHPNLKHQSLALSALRPLMLGNWVFDVGALASAVVVARDARFVPAGSFTEFVGEDRTRRPSDFQIPRRFYYQSRRRRSRRISFSHLPRRRSRNWIVSKTSLGLGLERGEEEENLEGEKRAV
jgi:hypothetical protein